MAKLHFEGMTIEEEDLKRYQRLQEAADMMYMELDVETMKIVPMMTPTRVFEEGDSDNKENW